MAYLKPQAPLMQGADYVYPITTADQVVMPDGNRLSATGVWLQHPDESESTETTGLNAETFGGMTYQQFVDLMYPKGRVIMTFENEDPNESYPWQTWERTAQGRFLIGAGDGYEVGSEGGEATHTLTLDEMPKHRHHAPIAFNTDGSNRAPDCSWTDHAPDATSSQSFTSYSGGGAAHNNMPPYTPINMWKRTA